jgi:transcriptional regulator with XRE-family HTH domain
MTFQPETLQEIIGRNIKERRVEIGMKGETLAKKLGQTKSSVSRLENGELDFKISGLADISKAVDTEVCSLVCKQTIKSHLDFEKLSSKEKTIVCDREIINLLLLENENLKAENEILRRNNIK